MWGGVVANQQGETKEIQTNQIQIWRRACGVGATQEMWCPPAPEGDPTRGKAAPSSSPRPEATHLVSSPQASDAPQVTIPSQEPKVSLCGPFKKSTPCVSPPGVVGAPLPDTSAPCPGAWCGWGWGPSLPWRRDVPPESQQPHAGAEPADSQLHLLQVLTWLLLYIFSYDTSVRVDFRWFSGLIALQFSCDFRVFPERSRCSLQGPL